MKVSYTNRAWEDLAKAYVWYDAQYQGLGEEFLECVEVALETIQDYPAIFDNRQDPDRMP